ncbi:MAG: hypothetical protein V4620_02910 [Bacteroidota bacterium]
MKNIGNFTIHQTCNVFVIDYTRSLKDWIDTIIALAIGLGCVVGVVFVASMMFEKFDWILLLPLGSFGFVAFLKLTDGIEKLFQKTGAVITIDKDAGLLIANYFWGKSRSLPFETIKCIQLNGQVDNIKTGKYLQRRVFCKVEVQTKDDKIESLVYINPTQIVRISDAEIDADVYTIGSKLAKFIAEKTGTPYQWTGFQEQDTAM